MAGRCVLRSACLGLLAAAAFLTLAATARAQVPPPPDGGFGLPVDCSMGTVCVVQNYIDHDPGKTWRDHTCGPLSYDGHTGTDIRVPSEIDMRRGVPVIAAAHGKVLIAHDGQPDLLMQDTGPGKSTDERNGNWVVLDHGAGWISLYAHMRQGSVAVQEGQQVARGDKLGLIGTSGNADFPHVHFSVSYRNTVIDPFTGTPATAACGQGGTTLWSPAALLQLPYRAGGLLAAGFLDRQPTHREVMDGIEPPQSLSAEAPVLIFWTGWWGLLKGDKQVITILAPDGEVFTTAEHVLERNQATESRWIGKKRRAEPWPAGRYRGLFRVERRVGDTTVILFEGERDVEIR